MLVNGNGKEWNDKHVRIAYIFISYLGIYFLLPFQHVTQNGGSESGVYETFFFKLNTAV